MSEYSDYIIELYRNPVKKQRLSKPTHTVSTSNMSCGDTVNIDLVIEEDIIRDIGWDGTGCAISQAGMSILADFCIGKTLAQVQDSSSEQVLNEIGIKLSPKRMRCALLGLEALRKLQ